GDGRARIALLVVVDPVDRPGDLADLGHQAQAQVNAGLEVEVPTLNRQISKKRQPSILKMPGAQFRRCRIKLALGRWDLFGDWNLELDVFSTGAPSRRLAPDAPPVQCPRKESYRHLAHRVPSA